MPLQPRTPITRLRPTTTDDGYGNQQQDWAAPAEQDFIVHWSPQAVSEVVNDEPVTVSRIKIFGWNELDLEATDRVVGPDGHTYEVDGEVLRSYHPGTGAQHHVRAYLKRAKVSAT